MSNVPMRDHWWWRPGWRVGRSFYTWHITFEDQLSVHQLAADYAGVLTERSTLDPVPPRWLHLTMQGLGFTDEVHSDDLADIVRAARVRCAKFAPFTVTLGPAEVDPEALRLPVHPAEPVAHLRSTLRDAIADVWGRSGVPEDAEGFRPHVSLAYSNAAGPADALTEKLTAHRAVSAEVIVDRISIIDLNRDDRGYEWTEVATVDLGARPTTAGLGNGTA